MNTQEKIDMGFDVRKVPETPKSKSNQNRDIDQNKIQNPYAKKYMEDKKTLVVKENIVGMLTNVKRKRNFESTNETIKFLCDLEKELTKKQMLKEFAKCPDCGASMSIDHVKKIHQHVDKNVECYGCLERGHKIGWGEEERKAIANAMLEREKAKKVQTEQSDQTDANDEDEINDERKEIPKPILVEYTAKQRAML